jgi:hypothetical protein
VSEIFQRETKESGYVFVTASRFPGWSYMLSPRENDNSLYQSLTYFVSAAHDHESHDARYLQKEAYHEALRRYPESHAALVFLWAALGLGAEKPTQEHINWAKRTLSLRQGE